MLDSMKCLLYRRFAPQRRPSLNRFASLDAEQSFQFLFVCPTVVFEFASHLLIRLPTKIYQPAAHRACWTEEISIRLKGTGSDDYSISLPGTQASQSITARGRHMSMSSSGDERTPSRQSTYSILDTRHIHVYLKKNDSESSLKSIQTITQETQGPGSSFVTDQHPSSSGLKSTKKSDVKHKKTNINGNNEDELNSQMNQLSIATRSTPNLTLAPQSPAALNVALRAHESAIRWRSATHDPEDDSYPRPRSAYIGEFIWQVDQVVYCGGIQAAQNLNLLCRLNIEYIVDLCGEESEIYYRTYNFARLRPECLCSRKVAHSRMTMSISLKDDSDPNMRVEMTDQQREDIITYFDDFIQLVRKAEACGKSVLIHSMKGRNRAPAFCAAYLMKKERITRMQALNQVSEMMSKTRPGLAVSDNLQRALMRWQTVLLIRPNENKNNNNEGPKVLCISESKLSNKHDI
ncbi:Tyrosine-protein phosphatase domain-containing protein [Aphelenchoides besseyi]|nr:Tyrosine-protein phosphatase domain-containing protein [Aphelenchoides besseyi]